MVPTDKKGVCENVYESTEIVNAEYVKYCVKCKSNYVIMYKIEKTTTKKLKNYWYNTNQEKTLI